VNPKAPYLVSCPQCGRLVDAQARQCPFCEIDLAWAAALAEQALTETASHPLSGHITPEYLVPRLGEYLLEKGVLTQKDLQRALEYQSSSQGQPRLLGQVLLELGLVDRETLDQVITEQILQLQNALQQSNRELERRVVERTQELQSALNRLTELNQLKSNFISNVSHELRTPLTHIKGYLDLMSDGSLGPLTIEQSDALDVLRRSENRLEEQIEELIQFSLASTGELTLILEPLNLNSLVSKVISLTTEKAANKGISLEKRGTNVLPPVKADEEKLTWVILELLDNAVKFTPAGGVVSVDTISEDKLVKIAIMDTGIGISPKHIEEIFEPFHQLDGSVTRRYGGVGLGLALVKRIIEAHGSSIQVRSEEGQGTRVEFVLSAHLE